MKRNILYLDKAPDAYVEVLESLEPEGFEIWYWDKMSEEEREAALPQAHFTINTTFRVKRDLIEKAKSPRTRHHPLFDLPNVIATPHASPGTLDTFRKCAAQAIENIVRAETTGQPIDVRGKIQAPRIGD